MNNGESIKKYGHEAHCSIMFPSAPCFCDCKMGEKTRMNNHTYQYHALLQYILDNGTWKGNRTGVRTMFVPGYHLRFDLSHGFPLITTKKVPFQSIIGELLCFLKGSDNAKDFRDHKCNVWNANANDPGTSDAPNAWLKSPHRKGEDDLGRIYGVQWRKWAGNAGVYDQVKKLLTTLETNPLDRRMIVSAWNVEDIYTGAMALPPCHVMHQVLYEPETNKLHMTMYQRSCDVFIGIPFNIASYAALLHMYAKVAGMTPGELSLFLADVHIYENHMDQVKEQLSRTPYPNPTFSCTLRPKQECSQDLLTQIYYRDVNDFQVVDYECHPPIKADMAV